MHLNNAHVSEIESVLAGGHSSRDEIVVESWKRCVGEHKLDPARPTEAYILPGSQLREHRERSERLITIARASVEDLFRQIAGQNYVLLLTNEQGVTVDFFGDEAFKQQLMQAGLYLGAEWSEARAGTCGVGSCIATGEALTVHQTDHFDNTHTPLSCTAAPIYDNQGVLSAVLDISLLRSPQPKISQNLALHLATASARRIEMAGLMNDMRSEWVLCLARTPAVLDVDPDAAVALDGSGRIIGMTHSGARILAELSGLSWRCPSSILGSRLSDYFQASVEDLPRLTRSYPALQRQILGNDNSSWFGHAIDPAITRATQVRAPKTPQKNKTQTLKPQLPSALDKLSGGDPVMNQLIKRLAKVVKTKLPILIHGETGTGKEYLARAIHESSNAAAPFVAINCAAIPEGLIEGELFGHAAGAFTGASRRGRPGLLEAADGGTLFLDEIGDMPVGLQARLLRFLSEGEVVRVGSVEVRRVDVRIVAASLHQLPELMKANLFRSDLYYRLNGVEVHLPPLCDRDDLSYLVDLLLSKHSAHAELTTSAWQSLRQYKWPGNLRELDSVLQLGLAMSDNGVIDSQDLPARLRGLQAMDAPAQAKTHPASQIPSLNDSQQRCDSLQLTLQAIEQAGGNMTRAAKALGVDRSTLYRRIRRQRGD